MGLCATLFLDLSIDIIRIKRKDVCIFSLLLKNGHGITIKLIMLLVFKTSFSDFNFSFSKIANTFAILCRFNEI